MTGIDDIKPGSLIVMGGPTSYPMTQLHWRPVPGNIVQRRGTARLGFVINVDRLTYNVLVVWARDNALRWEHELCLTVTVR